MRAIESGIENLIGSGPVYYEIIAVYTGGPAPSSLRVRACAKVDDQEYQATVVSPHWTNGVSTPL